MKTVPEKTTSYVTVTFRDKNGNLAVPVSARYRVDDKKSGAEIRTWTALGAASSIEITMNADDNTIYDADQPYETRVVTVEATYGSSDLLTETYEYQLRNLAFYP